jgi:hypothetical protein
MNENTLYYTLSTIAQTLAAAFGVLTAIVLVRLSTIQSVIGATKTAVHETWGNNFNKAWAAIREGGLDGLRKKQFNPDAQDVMRRSRFQAGYEAWLEWGGLVPSVKNALVPTGLDVAVCFLALPFVPSLCRSPVLAWIIMLGSVVLAVVCLERYGRLIMRLVARPTE